MIKSINVFNALKKLEKQGITKLSSDYYNWYLPVASAENHAELERTYVDLYDLLVEPAEAKVDNEGVVHNNGLIFDGFFLNKEGEWMALWSSPSCVIPVSDLIYGKYELLSAATKASMQEFYAIKMAEALHLPDQGVKMISSGNYGVVYPFGNKSIETEKAAKAAALKVSKEGYCPVLAVVDTMYVNVLFITDVESEAQWDLEQFEQAKPDVMAYVYNYKDPELSEFGYITIQEYRKGLWLRIA